MPRAAGWMKRRSGPVSFLIGPERPPGPRRRRHGLSHLQASRPSTTPKMAGGVGAPPKPEGPNVKGWGAWYGLPKRLDPAYPSKTAFRFPPGLILGGFLFGGRRQGS